MTNPILQNLNNNMPNNNLMSLIKSGNTDKIINDMMANNPQFRKFMADNKGKTPEQIAEAYGINLKDAISLIGNCK